MFEYVIVIVFIDGFEGLMIGWVVMDVGVGKGNI